MNITIRKAEFSDAANMDALNRKTLPENYPLHEWKTILSLKPDFSFVAYDGENIVGYCLGLLHPMIKKGIIASLAVDKKYRRKQIGRVLLQKTVDAFTQFSYMVDYMELHVRKSNIIAQSLYKSMGFTVTKTLTNYYADDEDGFIMTKKT